MDMKGYVKKLFLTGNLKYIILTEVGRNAGATPYRTLINIREKGIKLDAGSYYNSVKSLVERGHLKKSKGKRVRSFSLDITDSGKDFVKEYLKLFNVVTPKRGRPRKRK